MTTREERIEAMLNAYRKSDVSDCIRSRGVCKRHDECVCRYVAETCDDALFAMGAIMEPSGEFVARIVGAQGDHIAEVGKCLESNGNTAEQKD